MITDRVFHRGNAGLSYSRHVPLDELSVIILRDNAHSSRNTEPRILQVFWVPKSGQISPVAEGDPWTLELSVMSDVRLHANWRRFSIRVIWLRTVLDWHRGKDRCWIPIVRLSPLAPLGSFSAGLSSEVVGVLHAPSSSAWAEDLPARVVYIQASYLLPARMRAVMRECREQPSLPQVAHEQRTIVSTWWAVSGVNQFEIDYHLDLIRTDRLN